MESVPTLESINEVIELYNSEKKKSIRSLPLSDKRCLELFEWSKSQMLPSNLVSLLHICVNPPPCKKDEQELVTKKRKWCKGRGLKYGTKEFNNEVSKLSKIYAANSNIEKVDKNAAKDSLKTLKLLKNYRKDIPNVYEEYNKVKDIVQADSSTTEEEKDIEDIEKRVKLLNTQEIDDIEERVLRLTNKKFKKEINNEKDEVQFKNISKSLQKNKAILSSEKDILYNTKTSISSVITMMKQEKPEKRTKKEEQLNQKQEIDTGVEKAIEKMSDSISLIADKLKDLDKQIKDIDTKQEYTNKAARKVLGDQYWSEQFYELLKKGKYEIMKQVLTSPFKVLNIIVFRPAWNAFWTFFGRWAYLIWGLLMLFLIIISVFSFYLTLNKHYPYIISPIYEGLIYIWGSAVRSGSIVAQSLSPILGEGMQIIMENAKNVFIEGISYGKLQAMNFVSVVYTWFYELLEQILKGVIGRLNPLSYF